MRTPLSRTSPSRGKRSFGGPCDEGAKELGLPIFVISHSEGADQLRDVRVGWVQDWDDDDKLFVINRFWQTAVSLALLLLAAVNPLRAQQAEVTHDVDRRPDPSTDNPPIRLLKPPETAQLLEPGKTSGYYHVRTSQAEEGWTWAKNIHVISAGPTPTPTPPTVTPTPTPVAFFRQPPRRRLLRQLRWRSTKPGRGGLRAPCGSTEPAIVQSISDITLVTPGPFMTCAMESEDSFCAGDRRRQRRLRISE